MNPTSAASPGLRLFDLLEVLVREGRPLTLAEAVAASGWPKPTVHRLLGQLEAYSAGLADTVEEKNKTLKSQL